LSIIDPRDEILYNGHYSILMRLLIATTFAFSCCLCVHGGISSMDSQSIDFTKIFKEDSRITFEPSDKLSLTADGLGWDGDAKSEYDGSFTTAPIATGTAWRPTSGVTLVGTVCPASQVFRSGVWHGQLFVRYSPDKKHWSSWQVLQNTTEPKPGDKGTEFSGRLHVPQIERNRYDELIQQYHKLEVPWGSDEEAAVKGILQKQPDFFAKNLPFIGYIQFHFEGPFRGGQRITSFDYRISWGIGGLHLPPKDPDAYKKSEGPWRFDATKEK
jgi:hypothetical protein